MGRPLSNVIEGYEPTSAEDALTDLVALLWDERERLDALSAALTNYARSRRTGDEADLAASDAQVRTNAHRLQHCEVLRAAEVELLGDALGLPAGATLRELAASVPEPWAMILGEHRDALRELTRDVAALAAETNSEVWQRSLADFLL